MTSLDSLLALENPFDIGKWQAVNPGVGMPQALYLQQFGDMVWHAFGERAYHVGSSLAGKQWRDVDVRLILWDDAFDAMFPSRPVPNLHACGKWVALCAAFSELGKKMTGLPIDFQIQRMSDCNKEYDGPRSALIMTELRFTK